MAQRWMQPSRALALARALQYGAPIRRRAQEAVCACVCYCLSHACCCLFHDPPLVAASFHHTGLVNFETHSSPFNGSMDVCVMLNRGAATVGVPHGLGLAQLELCLLTTLAPPQCSVRLVAKSGTEFALPPEWCALHARADGPCIVYSLPDFPCGGGNVQVTVSNGVDGGLQAHGVLRGKLVVLPHGTDRWLTSAQPLVATVHGKRVRKSDDISVGGTDTHHLFGVYEIALPANMQAMALWIVAPVPIVHCKWQNGVPEHTGGIAAVSGLGTAQPNACCLRMLHTPGAVVSVVLAGAVPSSPTVPFTLIDDTSLAGYIGHLDAVNEAVRRPVQVS